ncbi:MAG: hypothetical protein J6I52_03300 [Prevotella sp.]|nr:hypothetical protein [Prevotella sp.]
MVTTQLNAAQLNVLNLMAYISTEQEQQELQDLLLQFYRKKTDSLLLQLQKDNGITQQTLDEWANQHERTPY